MISPIKDLGAVKIRCNKSAAGIAWCPATALTSSEVTVLNLCTSSSHALYCTKFCEIISNGIEVIEQTPFLYWKLQRGIIPQKNVGGATVVNLCMSSGHALYLCQVSWNNIKRYLSYRVNTISIRKITKGNNSAKNAGGATVVNLCMSSDHALNFYQVLWNYLKRYQSYRADTISILKITKGNNSAKKCTWSDCC